MAIENQLRMLASLGAQRKEINKFGHKIVLRLCNAGHTRDVYAAATGFDLYAREKIMAIKMLARVIFSIDGEQIQYESANGDDPITENGFYIQNEKIVEQWAWPIVSALYQEYLSFEQEADKAVAKSVQDFLGQKNG